MTQAKVETFEVVICSRRSGEVYAVVAATLETKQGRALLNDCEARVVPAGKFKVGQTVAEPAVKSDSVVGLPR